ncbi:hypothetical protein DH86_00003105, partial [Scytalidium sp. 3C]
IKVEKLREAAKKLQPLGSGFITASELGHIRKRCYRISTGSKQLDACLNGGFQTMSISEVYGEFSMTGWFQSSACVNHRLGCGKTQLAHTMAVTAQLPKIQKERFVQRGFLKLRSVSAMQTELLETLTANFATNEYRLLIIDSVMALFRTDYIGRGELSDRQALLNQFLRKATSLAEEFNIAVLMVRL